MMARGNLSDIQSNKILWRTLRATGSLWSNWVCFGNYWVYFENSRRRPLLVGNTDRAFWGKMKLHLHRSIQIKCKYNVKKKY